MSSIVQQILDNLQTDLLKIKRANGYSSDVVEVNQKLQKQTEVSQYITINILAQNDKLKESFEADANFACDFIFLIHCLETDGDNILTDVTKFLLKDSTIISTYHNTLETVPNIRKGEITLRNNNYVWQGNKKTLVLVFNVEYYQESANICGGSVTANVPNILNNYTLTSSFVSATGYLQSEIDAISISGANVWGTITGNILNQSDLVNAFSLTSHSRHANLEVNSDGANYSLTSLIIGDYDTESYKGDYFDGSTTLPIVNRGGKCIYSQNGLITGGNVTVNCGDIESLNGDVLAGSVSLTGHTHSEIHDNFIVQALTGVLKGDAYVSIYAAPYYTFANGTTAGFAAAEVNLGRQDYNGVQSRVWHFGLDSMDNYNIVKSGQFIAMCVASGGNVGINTYPNNAPEKFFVNGTSKFAEGITGSKNIYAVRDVIAGSVSLTGHSHNQYTLTSSMVGYSLTSHNHSLSSLSEKSYNSLADLPDLGVYSLIATTNSKARVYLESGAQSHGGGGWEKILFDTVNFDVNSEYDYTTNFNFIAQSDGYYQVNSRCLFTSINDRGDYGISLFINDTHYSQGNRITNYFGGEIGLVVSDLVYLATNDKLEIFAYDVGGGVSIERGTDITYLSIHKLS